MQYTQRPVSYPDFELGAKRVRCSFTPKINPFSLERVRSGGVMCNKKGVFISRTSRDA